VQRSRGGLSLLCEPEVIGVFRSHFVPFCSARYSRQDDPVRWAGPLADLGGYAVLPGVTTSYGRKEKTMGDVSTGHVPLS